jgi:hypothetical protein
MPKVSSASASACAAKWVSSETRDDPLRTYTTQTSAYATQARLEAQRIPVFLKNGETIGLAAL